MLIRELLDIHKQRESEMKKSENNMKIERFSCDVLRERIDLCKKFTRVLLKFAMRGETLRKSKFYPKKARNTKNQAFSIILRAFSASIRSMPFLHDKSY